MRISPPLLEKAYFRQLAERGRTIVKLAITKSGATDDHARHALHEGLGTLLQLLKRQRGLSDRQVAEQAGIDEEELLKIETLHDYEPSPRTISRLEQIFELPKRSIAVLTGAITVNRTGFTEQVVQFAAKSAALGTLNREERRHLGEFVKMLALYTDESQ